MPEEEKDEFEETFNELNNVDDDKFESEEDELELEQDAADNAADEQEQETTDEDVWEGLTEKQQAAVAALEVDRDQWLQKYRSDEGRITAYQRQTEDYKRQLEEQSTKKEPETTSDAEGDEFWTALQEDDPDLANAIDGRLGSNKQPAIDPDTQKKIDLMLKREDERVVTAELAALEAAHPDYQAVVNSPDFYSWMDKQPDNVKGMFNSDSAREAVSFLNYYKSQSPDYQPKQSSEGDQSPTVDQIKAERQKKLSNSSTQVKGKGIAPKAEGPDDYDAAFNYYATKKARGQSQ